MSKISKQYYSAKVQLLSKEETERLLSRMGGKLDRRLEKNKISQEEALARQLELEDEQLQKWRKVVLNLKAKEAKKAAEARIPSKTKSPAKVKATSKIKTASKTKAPAKAKSSAKTQIVKKTKVAPSK